MDSEHDAFLGNVTVRTSWALVYFDDEQHAVTRLSTFRRFLPCGNHHRYHHHEHAKTSYAKSDAAGPTHLCVMLNTCWKLLCWLLFHFLKFQNTQRWCLVQTVSPGAVFLNMLKLHTRCNIPHCVLVQKSLILCESYSIFCNSRMLRSNERMFTVQPTVSGRWWPIRVSPEALKIIACIDTDLLKEKWPWIDE